MVLTSASAVVSGKIHELERRRVIADHPLLGSLLLGCVGMLGLRCKVFWRFMVNYLLFSLRFYFFSCSYKMKPIDFKGYSIS